MPSVKQGSNSVDYTVSDTPGQTPNPNIDEKRNQVTCLLVVCLLTMFPLDILCDLETCVTFHRALSVCKKNLNMAFLISRFISENPNLLIPSCKLNGNDCFSLFPFWELPLDYKK